MDQTFLSSTGYRRGNSVIVLANRDARASRGDGAERGRDDCCGGRTDVVRATAVFHRSNAGGDLHALSHGISLTHARRSLGNDEIAFR